MGPETISQEHEALWDQLTSAEIEAKTNELLFELSRERGQFMRSRIKAVRQALSSEVFALNYRQILQQARKDADSVYLRQFLQRLWSIYEDCLKRHRISLKSQILKSVWLSGVEPRWTRAVRTIGAGLKRLYRNNSPESVSERVRALEVEAGRIHDEEVHHWRVKIEEAACNEKLAHAELSAVWANSKDVTGTQSRGPASPAKRTQKHSNLSRYFDAVNLTELQRECASLRWEYRMGVSEIAQHLDRHHSTVQYHLLRARQKMQNLQVARRAMPRPSLE